MPPLQIQPIRQKDRGQGQARKGEAQSNRRARPSRVLFSNPDIWRALFRRRNRQECYGPDKGRRRRGNRNNRHESEIENRSPETAASATSKHSASTTCSEGADEQRARWGD